MSDNLTVINFDDGRLLLKLDGRHKWVNTPNHNAVFTGKEAIYDWFDFILKNIEKMEWLEDYKAPKVVKDEGVVIKIEP